MYLSPGPICRLYPEPIGLHWASLMISVVSNALATVVSSIVTLFIQVYENATDCCRAGEKCEFAMSGVVARVNVVCTTICGAAAMRLSYDAYVFHLTRTVPDETSLIAYAMLTAIYRLLIWFGHLLIRFCTLVDGDACIKAISEGLFLFALAHVILYLRNFAFACWLLNSSSVAWLSSSIVKLFAAFSFIGFIIASLTFCLSFHTFLSGLGS
jgi:hypothetical protein